MCDSRRPPADVRLQLRQEAGYGCCFCGNPLVEYHHIRTYADAVAVGDPPHVAADMMLVCPGHHALITNGTIDEHDQRAAKRRPKNIARGFVEGRLHLSRGALHLSIGATQVEDWFAFAVDDELLLALTIDDSGHIEVTLRVYDDHGNVLAHIVKNDWLSRADVAGTDVTFKGRMLSLRRPDRSLLLEVDASRAPAQRVKVRGTLGNKGAFLNMTRSSTEFGSRTTHLKGIAGIRGLGFLVDSTTQGASFVTSAERILSLR